MSKALVTLMPLNFNGCDLLKRAIPTLIKAAEHSVHEVAITVIDNASVDDSKAWMSEHHPNIEFLSFEENLKLSAYNNAIERCESPYVMILNNDVLVTPNFIDALVERLSNVEHAFAVSPKITADDEHEVWKDRLSGNFFHGHLGPQKLGEAPGGTLFCHGAATLVRRDRFLELGGFDPIFFYGEDNDLSYRAWRRGFSCLFEPSVSVHHLGSQSVKKLKDGLEQRRAFKERANSFFVLKNVQNEAWKSNYKIWNRLKLFKMVLTMDRKRYWAMRETQKHRAMLMKLAALEPRVDDEVLMKKIAEMTLPPLHQSDQE